MWFQKWLPSHRRQLQAGGGNMSSDENTGKTGLHSPAVTGELFEGPAAVCLPNWNWSGGCHRLPAAHIALWERFFQCFHHPTHSAGRQYGVCKCGALPQSLDSGLLDGCIWGQTVLYFNFRLISYTVFLCVALRTGTNRTISILTCEKPKSWWWICICIYL